MSSFVYTKNKYLKNPIQYLDGKSILFLLPNGIITDGVYIYSDKGNQNIMRGGKLVDFDNLTIHPSMLVKFKTVIANCFAYPKHFVPVHSIEEMFDCGPDLAKVYLKFLRARGLVEFHVDRNCQSINVKIKTKELLEELNRLERVEL